MRKEVLALLLVLAVTVSAVGAAAVCVGNREEQVTYGEKVLCGDTSAADGLTVSVRYGYKNHAYWFVDHAFGEADTTQTDFRYYTLSNTLYEGDPRYDGVAMGILGDLSRGGWFDIFRNEKDRTEYPGMLGAYKQLYDETAEGELTNTYIRYADYCEYYPLFGYISIPRKTITWNSYVENKYETTDGKVTEAFTEYFKIPVLEDDWVQFVIDKRVHGAAAEAVDVTYSRKGDDYYDMTTVGICHQNTVYFTINAHTYKGNLVDTSLIPGGYGLYAFNYADDGTVDYDSLTTLCALDSTHVPCEMQIDEENNHLLYFTQKELSWYLTVIDLDNGEIIQQELLHTNGENKWFWYRVQEDIILCFAEEESITVWQTAENGIYQRVFTTPLMRNDDYYYNSDIYNSEFAYNGEYLAAAGQLWEMNAEAERHWYADSICGFTLCIYSEEGLVYSGEYTSSLQPAVNGNQKCEISHIALNWA